MDTLTYAEMAGMMMAGVWEVDLVRWMLLIKHNSFFQHAQDLRRALNNIPPPFHNNGRTELYLAPINTSL